MQARTACCEDGGDRDRVVGQSSDGATKMAERQCGIHEVTTPTQSGFEMFPGREQAQTHKHRHETNEQNQTPE